MRYRPIYTPLEQDSHHLVEHKPDCTPYRTPATLNVLIIISIVAIERWVDTMPGKGTLQVEFAVVARVLDFGFAKENVDSAFDLVARGFHTPHVEARL
jgi:hypothetical protein